MSRFPNSHSMPPELQGEPDAADLERTWALLGSIEPASRGEVEGEVEGQALDRAWQRLEAAMEGDDPATERLDVGPRVGREEGQPRPGSPRRNPWARLLLAAASVAALALGVTTFSSVTVEAGPGALTQVTLPDGSSAELNSGSTLTHPRWALPWGGGTRAVRLAGEAYFDVVSAPQPFTVETFNARVVVLGTRFNVRARDEVGGGTDVALETGRVRLEARPTGSVRDHEGRATVELEPGQGAGIPVDAGVPGPPIPVTVARATAWRARGFAVTDRPLDAILRELERRFAVEIQVAPGVELGDKLTLHYTDPREIRTILADIATARGLRFRETSRGFEIY
jgi:transmembrane sensor